MAEAADATTALATLRSSRHPYVVLVDLVMPTPDGVDFLRTVAVDYFLAYYHRFIAMTAGRADGLPMLNPAFHLPPVPVLYKPFELNDLLALVARAAGSL